MINLFDDVNSIKGIGAKKTDRLKSIGIFRTIDLLEHFPFRYRDRRIVKQSNLVKDEELALVVGELVKIHSRQLARGKSILECQLKDAGGIYSATFFNMPYLKQNLVIGREYSLYGMMKIKNNFRVWTNPEIAELGTEKDRRGIIPVYRCTQGVTNNDFYKWNMQVLNDNSINEWIDEEIIAKNKLCNRDFAFKNIHFPEGEKHYKAAKYRLIYEQLLIYQLGVRLNRKELERNVLNASVPDSDISELYDILPFELTEGQKECLQEIEKDLISSKPMNRLVQGDVGCGKTVVAELAMYKCVKSGFQTAMMAPTELLARQHYERLIKDYSKLGIKTALLVSGLKSEERRNILSGIADGSIDVVIGTHAIIQDDVEFKNLAIVITDEQHRFGVNQRKTLVEKGRGVNVCVMSATPIPRTLAATVYGDMDYSVIKSKPANRLEIITHAVDESSRERAYVALRNELEKGHQAYVIAPSIDSEDEDISSVEKLYEELVKKYDGYRVELIHGRLSKEDKESIMNEYASGKVDILVATVVIEVGIDVANATIIILENSERYGLAQMHQLRGRVGRSDKQSYCYLVNYSRSETAIARAKVMSKMSDGFDISEEDYKLRGPGDLMGTMQSGNFTSHIMSLCNYSDILKSAIQDAEYIVDNPGKTDLKFVREYLLNKTVTDNSNII